MAANLTPRPTGSEVRRLARRQHGLVAVRQLEDLGFSRAAIRHREAQGRLVRIRRGVYAIGRADVSQLGRWMAAVLACPLGTVLSHLSAAALLKIRPHDPVAIHVSLPGRSSSRQPGLVVHRPTNLSRRDVGTCESIPTTSPIRTLIDLATLLSEASLEAAVNEADKHALVDPGTLRTALDHRAGQPGVRPLRALLDRHAFLLTDSELERRFLSICRRHRLPLPETQVHLEGNRVDFLFREQGVVVETDGGRFHRTALQQTRDREREHAHLADGLIPVRFTHHQIGRTPGAVAETLKGAFGLGRGVQSA